jgi:hypothetical protein
MGGEQNCDPEGLYPRHQCRVPHLSDFLCSFVGPLKLLNATNLDRKSGMRGTKTMGEVHNSPSFQNVPLSS